MKVILALLVGLLFTGAASACECAFAPLTPIEARTASIVFAFRLLDARIEQSTGAEGSDSVVGNIQIVARFRGSPAAEQVRYSVSPCCGSRLEVGKYYIAFLPKDSHLFDGNSSNLRGLFEPFSQHHAELLERLLNGTDEHDSSFYTTFLDISQFPAPPPPCLALGVTAR